ncbi:MAG: hypothetical protein FWD83_05145 [Promicromonosporaceae bacterium]|nr:hypothetical protein [Promicromonosporaceae bacterium]
MTKNATPRSRRALAALGVGAVAALALTGCMRMNLDFEVHSNDTVDASMVFAFSDDVAELMGMDPDALWDMAGDEITGDLPPGATQEPFAEGGFTGVRVTLANEPLAAVGGAGVDDLSIVRQGDEFVMTGTLDLDMDDLDEMPANLLGTMDVRVSLTFPGPISDTNGSVSGNTVTWNPAVGEVTSMHARASAIEGSASDGIPLLVWVGIGVAALALIGILAVVALKPKAATSVAAPAAGVAPMAPMPPASYGAPVEAPVAPGSYGAPVVAPAAPADPFATPAAPAQPPVAQPNPFAPEAPNPPAPPA